MDRLKLYLDKITNLSSDTYQEILGILTERQYKKEDFFAKDGKVETRFGIVLDGLFHAYISKDNGTQYTKTFFTPIHFKMPISFMGALSSLVTQTINHVNIEALTKATVLEGNFTELMNLADRNKEVADWYRKLIELFFIGKERREFEYFSLQADARYKLFRQQYPELENLISQYYIAQFIGITPTQLSRIRKKIFAEQ